MSSRPTPSRPGHNHAPANPSGLRQAFTASSYGSMDGGSDPASPETSDDASSHRRAAAGPSRQRPTETTALLDAALDFREPAHEGPCNHGVFSPRPTSPLGNSHGDSPSPDESETDASLRGPDGVSSSTRQDKKKKGWASRIKSKKMTTSRDLAQRHGFKDSPFM